MQTENISRNGLLTYSSRGFSQEFPTTNLKTVHVVLADVTDGDRKRPNPVSFYGYKSEPHEHFHYTRGYTNTDGIGWWDSSLLGKVLVDDGYAVFGSLLGGNTAEENVWPRLSDEAISDVYDQVRGSANTTVDFAERHETMDMLKMFKGTHKGIHDLLGWAAKVTRGKTPRRGLTRGQMILDTASSAWLGYRYGIMPLIYSTYDALETLDKQLKRVVGQNPRLRGRASAQTRSEGVWTYNGTPYRVIEVGNFTVQHLVQFTNVAFQNNVWDWGSLNPWLIAWEAAPLSFVADWFWNVSQTLSLWENYMTYTSLTQSVVTTKRLQRRVIVRNESEELNIVSPGVNGNYPDHIRSVRHSSGFTRRDYSKIRTVAYDLPMPAGVRWKINLNAKRHLDAAGLMHQLVGKSSRGLMP